MPEIRQKLKGNKITAKFRTKKASLFREAFYLMVLIPRIELGTSSLPRMRSTD